VYENSDVKRTLSVPGFRSSGVLENLRNQALENFGTPELRNLGTDPFLISIKR
jgi:hypothetical protein